MAAEPLMAIEVECDDVDEVLDAPPPPTGDSAKRPACHKAQQEAGDCFQPVSLLWA